MRIYVKTQIIIIISEPLIPIVTQLNPVHTLLLCTPQTPK
jgi:hypothetical protein